MCIRDRGDGERGARRYTRRAGRTHEQRGRHCATRQWPAGPLSCCTVTATLLMSSPSSSGIPSSASLTITSNRSGSTSTMQQAVSYTHLRAHETVLDLVCRLLLEKKKKKKT